MKVLALSEGYGGSHFYRLEEPARVAKKLGVDVVVDDGIDGHVTIDEKTSYATVHHIDTDADLIVIQRPLRQIWTSVIEQAKRQGIATIVELDDDYETIHRDNIANGNFVDGSVDHPRWVRSACEIADFVSISTPTLAKYARHNRSVVLRNCVPESVLSIRPRTTYEKPVIGWTGSVATHPTDLLETKGTVGRFLHTNNLPFSVVGDGENVREHLGILERTPMSVSGWVPVEDYHQTVADSFSIGIVPLELSPFNHAKSALKGLEMAALGIPFVASPTREYERLAAYGIGKLAGTRGEWAKQLQRMVDRPAETEKLIGQYRETIYNEMTYERRAHDWVTAWEQAIQYRKKHHG